jgi:hypothetical protein
MWRVEKIKVWKINIATCFFKSATSIFKKVNTYLDKNFRNTSLLKVVDLLEMHNFHIKFSSSKVVWKSYENILKWEESFF